MNVEGKRLLSQPPPRCSQQEPRPTACKWSLPCTTRLASPLTVPYGLVVRARNALYDRGWLSKQMLPCPVISVGNLTVGGTGKTPVVIWTVDRLLAKGFRVGVLSRGYRRRSREPRIVVSDGQTILAGPDEAGDEPYLIASRCPGAVVAVGADRYRLGRWVYDRFPLDYVVLDDGFQHRALHRDVDLLLVDASDPAGLEGLFPVGRLREPLASASRATALLLTRADAAPELQRVLTRIRTAAERDFQPILIRFIPEAYIDLPSGDRLPMERGAGRVAVIFSGVANAASFRRLLARQGVNIAAEVVFADHHTYTEADIERLRERAKSVRADVFMTTEKDAVKIRPLVRTGEAVWAVRLRTEIMEGRDRLEQLIMMNAER